MNTSTNKLESAEDFSDLISQAEAARIRECKQQAIFNLIARGKLQPIKIGGKIFVRRSEVVAYVPEPGGRPRKKSAAKKKTTPKKKSS